jgi:hypothetical protein
MTFSLSFSASFRVISSHRCQDHPTREKRKTDSMTWQTLERVSFFFKCTLLLLKITEEIAEGWVHRERMRFD